MLKKGDIVICTRNEFSGIKLNLEVGGKYEVYEQFDDKVILIIDEKGRVIIASSYILMPIEMYRDFKLKQILK